MSDMEQLARRAVSCDGFRWMPGMLCLVDEDGYAARVLSVGLKASTSETADAYSGGGIITRGSLKNDSLPDLDDPATLGCLLALVREELDDPRIHCRQRANRWRCFSGVTPVGGGVTPVGRWADTEAEALVAVLEAASVRMG